MVDGGNAKIVGIKFGQKIAKSKGKNLVNSILARFQLFV